MKQVTVQSNGVLGFLGRIELRSEELAMVNGRAQSADNLAATTANINGTPDAKPDTGFLGTTRVATARGPVAVQELREGDLVFDAHGAEVAVTHILKTPVTKTAICIRAPYFGLNQDIVIGAQHRIAVTSHTAEYLFGEETVLVPVWALKDGRKAQHWENDPNTCFYQIQLETLAALKVGNCVIESMPKSGQSIGKVLSEEEARCFACEHKSGYQN
ncbi:MAG: Hint domain-containing protein [Pseudomonadota bacterium]